MRSIIQKLSKMPPIVVTRNQGHPFATSLAHKLRKTSFEVRTGFNIIETQIGSHDRPLAKWNDRSLIAH